MSNSCSNCNSKLGKAFLGSENNALNPESTEKLNQFLPESLRRDSFCQRCLDITFSKTVLDDNVLKKFRRYIRKLEKERQELNEKYISLEGEIQKKISDRYIVNRENVKLYSTVPQHLKLIEYVESFLVVNSGMWSTSSDNLDAMWSAIHDNMAREGKETNNLLGKGFYNTQDLIKKASFVKGGNAVVDVKYNFSELASNGKILVHCQGTAAYDEREKKIDFQDIYDNFKIELDKLRKQLDQYDILFEKYTEAKLLFLLKPLNP